MEWKKIFFSSMTFIIGILIGAGFTKNKYVAGIIITYIIFMIGFRLLGSKLKNVKEATDKKLAMRNEGVKSWNEFVDTTEKGHTYGGDLFDKYYPEYIFYINTIVFITMIVMLFMKMWIWSLVCFFGVHALVVLNQIYRNTKKEKYEMGEEIKDE